jgi:hypothetical protein
MRDGLKQMLLPAAAGLIAGAAAFAAPALAHPEGGKTDRIMILHTDGGEQGEAGKRPLREFHVMRMDGKGPAERCDGDKTEIEDEKDGRKTRFFLCTDGRLSSAERAEKMEQALERIQSNEHMSAEHKERVAVALREAISRVRETN